MPSGPAPDPKSGSAGGKKERSYVGDIHMGNSLFVLGGSRVPWHPRDGTVGNTGISRLVSTCPQPLSPQPSKRLGCLMSDLINWDG